MRPISKLFLPPSSLSGCLFVAVYRDTRGAALSNTDRVNHFPASPLMSITLVQCGELRLLPTGRGWPAAQGVPALPRLFVMGPQNAPVSSWAPAEITALTIGIYPDAWLRLGGNVDFSRVPDNLAMALKGFAELEDPEAGWDAFCQMIGAVWSQARPSSWHGATEVADWARSVMTRAALSGSGRSLRSLERRIKRFSGQTRRTLRFYSAIDNLHRISQQSSETRLAEIAVEAGYADQSHMGRAVRRATGFSPAHLNRAIKQEEAFWCYRLLGERF